LIVELKERIAKAGQSLLNQVLWLAGKTPLVLNAHGEFVPPSSDLSPRICVFMPGTYVAVTRSYKAISKRELQSIIANEAEFLSPFEVTRTLHTEQDHQDGSWSVRYFFIDRSQFGAYAEAPLILLGEYFFELAAIPTIVKTPLGAFLVGFAADTPVVRPNGAGLAERYFGAELASQKRSEDWRSTELRGRLLSWSFVSRALSLKGCFDGGAIVASARYRLLQSRLWTWLGAGFLAWMTLQSAYLMSTGWWLEHRQSSGSEVRNQYAIEKRDYLDSLDQVVAMQTVVERQIRVSAVAELLAELQNIDGLELNRFDFVDGEFRIAGVVPNIDTLMTALGAQDRIIGLDFVAPIMPDRSGKDRFQLRFEVVQP
jgi:hypothetical protein